LRRVGRERPFPGRLLLVGVAGQEALRERDDLDALAVGPLQARDDLLQVRLEITGLRLQLPVPDAHGVAPRGFDWATARFSRRPEGGSRGRRRLASPGSEDCTRGYPPRSVPGV